MTKEDILINYLAIGDNFSGYHSSNNREWHYIMSNLEDNKLLIDKLNKEKLLKQTTNICDAGLGFGSALFDLYLQSLDISEKSFNFFGIEKNKFYINYLESNLLHFWKDNIKIIHSDLTIQNYSNYDIVYTYLPYKNNKDLLNFYSRVSNDLKIDSIIIENSESGNSELKKIKSLQEIDLDGKLVFRKI